MLKNLYSTYVSPLWVVWLPVRFNPVLLLGPVTVTRRIAILQRFTKAVSKSEVGYPGITAIDEMRLRRFEIDISFHHLRIEDIAQAKPHGALSFQYLFAHTKTCRSEWIDQYLSFHSFGTIPAAHLGTPAFFEFHLVVDA